MKLTRSYLRTNEYAMERKAIKWEARSTRYEGVHSGACIINFVSADDAHPLHTTPIYGDQLDRAFWVGNTLCYRDSRREVEIEFIND